MNEQWTNKIKGWLEGGKDGADKIVDIPWEVSVEAGENYDSLLCKHPSIPFEIMTTISSDFVTLYLDTMIPTDAYDTVARMRLYRTLLKKNLNWNLVKTSLIGDENRIAISVDLDISSLGKEEFDTALNNVVYASMEVIDVLGLKEELRDWFFNQVASDCDAMLSEGKTREEILAYLVGRVGWDEDNARKMLDSLEKAHEEAHAPGPRTGTDAYIR